MEDFQIPRKLMKLVGMTLTGTRSEVRVEDLILGRGVKQGDVLSILHFNFTLEKAIRQLPINHGGTNVNRLMLMILSWW